VTLLLFGLVACRGDEGGVSADVGAPCSGARDCDTGLCIDTGGARVCTIECDDEADCAAGMTCARFGLAIREDGEDGEDAGMGEAVHACAPRTTDG
jgi:hypothetical protein